MPKKGSFLASVQRRLRRPVRLAAGGKVRGPVPAATGNLPIAAMTMCWNEEGFLTKWVDYYGDRFGRENLYILAHGGEEVVHDIARGCKIYDLPRRVIDHTRDKRRARLVEGFFNFLLGDHRAIVFGDIDEFMVVDPDVGTLGGVVDGLLGQYGSIKGLNLNVVDSPEAGALDYARPIFAQRRLARTRYQLCKPTIVYMPASFGAGFHYNDHEPHVVDGLYMVHLHHADRATNERIAQQRRATFDQQPGLEAAPLRRNRISWKDFLSRYESYNAEAAGLPIRQLDEVAPKLRAAMRANIIPGQADKPNWGNTMSYGDMDTEFRIEIPDRFARVF